MKNVLMIIGMFAVGSFICIAVLIGIFVYVGTKYDTSSKSYLDANIPPIISNWSQSELEKRESPELRKVAPPEAMTKYFGIFSKLGPMKSYDGATGDAKVNYTTGGGWQISAHYLVDATFQNGKAEIDVVLIQENGQWEIEGFHVNSDALMK